ncbi:MAG TPA: hypothetical protein VFR23_19820 [Jiangellaceae bacterium]|nr:hypothetical protein [Jiangellaceae bacterium]
MSVERRLREGFARNANSLDPWTELRLEQVLGRHKRRVRIRWAASVLAAAAAITAVVAFGPRLVERVIGTPDPAAPSTPTVVQELSGAFATIVEEGSSVVRDHDLAGNWSMRLNADGTMVVNAPASYGGVLSAALFEAAADRFRTSVFEQDLCSGQGVGIYAWSLADGVLTLTPVDDSCEGRVAVLASSTWQQIP